MYKEMLHFPGGIELRGIRFLHITHNGIQFEIYKLLLSRNFLLVFSDYKWPEITESVTNFQSNYAFDDLN